MHHQTQAMKALELLLVRCVLYLIKRQEEASAIQLHVGIPVLVISMLYVPVLLSMLVLL